MEWGDWFQDIAGKYATSAIDDRYNNQFTLDKMRLQALGPLGAIYNEGQPGTVTGNVQAAGSIPTSWLLIGAVIAVVMLAGD